MSKNDIDPELFILNENNQLITSTYIENMLLRYGVKHKIKDIELFRRALIHKSYLKVRKEEYMVMMNKNKNIVDIKPLKDPEKAIPLQEKSYERLEFLGDSVLHLILADYLFKRYEGENEGFMTRLRTKIENGSTLAHLCRTIGLNKYILLSRYMEQNDGRDKMSILEDAFEAFIASLFLEGGFEPCKKFVIKIIEEEIDFAQLLYHETNYKDLLLQYFHKMRWEDPTYGNLNIMGSDYKKKFLMYAKRRKHPKDVGDVIGFGEESSKKKGQQEAARQALIKFNVMTENDNDDSSTIEEISSEEEYLEESGSEISE